MSFFDFDMKVNLNPVTICVEGSEEQLRDKIWSLDNIPREMIRADLPRLSKCEIEIDARCRGMLTNSNLNLF